MPQTVNRGFFPSDLKEFGDGTIPLLQRVQKDILYLIDHGYDLVHAVTFAGDHFQLSARQRTALTRATASTAENCSRKQRLCTGPLVGETIYIDGFNLIITLEAAFSPQTTLLQCTDGTIRDLCGLRGTYRLIDSTQAALELVAGALKEKQAAHAVFYLDQPVSNSGRLKQAILAVMEQYQISCEAHLVPNADALLWDKNNVITSDGIILNRCGHWINLAAEITGSAFKNRRIVHLSGPAV